MTLGLILDQVDWKAKGANLEGSWNCGVQRWRRVGVGAAQGAGHGNWAGKGRPSLVKCVGQVGWPRRVEACGFGFFEEAVLWSSLNMKLLNLAWNRMVQID